jgi:spermidine synthase
LKKITEATRSKTSVESLRRNDAELAEAENLCSKPHANPAKVNHAAVIRVVIATGISSVVTQLLTIREFLSQFQGNEIVIALILFNWLILGGLGTRAARLVAERTRKPSANVLAWLSLVLSLLSVLQILAIRLLRDIIFIQGSSVGFYPTLLFSILTLAPYCLLLGFVLPYSLFVMQSESVDYPGARIYIFDNIGDVCGGALFSFALVFLVSPLTAIFLAHLPLLVFSYVLFAPARRNQSGIIAAILVVTTSLGSGIILETTLLAPVDGQLVFYRESRYGRITVHQDREQFTLFENGVPLFSNQNRSLAEETIHYPLSQLDTIQHVLLISGQGNIMTELEKYPIQSVDYLELDPHLATVQFRFDMIKKIKGLRVLHQDGRAYLAQSDKIYDAIIVNLPEPNTFQINRFYTDVFFEMVSKHLAKNGVLSFCMQGFDNYLAEPQRQKLSSLYNTVALYFEHVLLLPGQKVYFLCRNDTLNTDIPAILEKKGIATAYIKGFFYGNVSPQRIDRLNRLMDRSTPRNNDTAPYLMRLMFEQWFAKFQTSPMGFFIVVAILAVIYLLRITREAFVLFSTGAMTMGSEILVIFAFQIFFGYIYLQIGIIITLFLAGLLPGAWLGHRLRHRGRQVLTLTDLFLMVCLILFILAIQAYADRLPMVFYLVFGFVVSLACGFQFPVALHLRGEDRLAVTRSFSADLMGAACGTLLTSVILIPYMGILWAAGGLIGLKAISLVLIVTSKT